MIKITRWLLLPLIAVSFQAKAQDYTISFAISDSDDTPSSVLVKNTTQGTSVSLNGNDELHLLAQLSGIDNAKASVLNDIEVYPNPVEDAATLTFVNPEAGKVRLSIINTAGVLMEQLSSELPTGKCSYSISGLSSGNYIVQVQAGNYKRSCILVSQLETASNPKIRLNGVERLDREAMLLKSAYSQQTVEMQYNAGDVLEFTASTGEKDVVVDNYVADADDEIEFLFSYAVKFVDFDGTELMSETVNYGLSATAPDDPSRTGYTFDGWDVAFADVTSDLTVTATYSLDTYRISYSNVGTKNADGNPETYTIESAAISLVAPSDSAGYMFGGWFTNAEMTEEAGDPAIPQGSSGDLTFYAKWDGASVSDIDGNEYQVVTIGTQTWMAENLRTLHFPNNVAIPVIESNESWGNLKDNNEDKACCFYENNAGSGYGVLYSYAAATNGTPHDGTNNVQGPCMDGWHLPSLAEWNTLRDYLSDNGFKGDEGAALKATSSWDEEGNGTDDFGFSALPGGMRLYSSEGVFGHAGKEGDWWTSTDNSNDDKQGIFVYMRYSYDGMSISITMKSYGYSIRCVKD